MTVYGVLMVTGPASITNVCTVYTREKFLIPCFFHFCNHPKITTKHLHFASGCCNSVELIMWSQAVLTWSCRCKARNLLLNVSKTKELVVDLGRRQQRKNTPPRVNRRGWLGVHITENLTWSRFRQLSQLSEGPKHFPLWCCGKATDLGTSLLRTVAWCN